MESQARTRKDATLARLALAAIVAVGGMSCAHRAQHDIPLALHDIPLVWNPTSQLSEERGAVDTSQLVEVTRNEEGEVRENTIRTEEAEGGRLVDLTAAAGRTIRVEALVDRRQNPERIGENREDDLPKLVTTRDDVALWCTDRLKFLLEQHGFDTTNEQGDLVVRGEVRRFFVVERHTYEADVALRISVEVPGGKLVWSGLTSGVANRFGGSYKAENYYEALSDAFAQAVGKLANSRSFQKAIAHR